MSDKFSKDEIDDVAEQVNKKFIDKIINNYEELLRNIQEQVDFYKKKHEDLRQEINTVIKENHNLSTELANLTNQSNREGTEGDYKKLANKLINNLRQQIISLTNEKNSIEGVWKTSQRIIANLETALREYSRAYSGNGPSIENIRCEYTTAIKKLDANIVELKEKLNTQIAINKNLADCKSEVEKNFKILDKKYRDLFVEQKKSISNLHDTEQSLSAAKKRIDEIMKERVELERSLEISNANARDHMCRETEALQKVQDALQIAETALMEKNEAIRREQAIKEECEFLATTISQVMTDAANKVEQEMDEIREQCDEKMKCLNLKIDSLKMSLKTQTERADLAETRSKNLESQLKNLLRTNSQLDSDLHVASQTIIEMELKLAALQNIMCKEEESNRVCEERANELQEFLKYNRKIKEKWRANVDEITTKLMAEIQQLKLDNKKLCNININLKRELEKKL